MNNLFSSIKDNGMKSEVYMMYGFPKQTAEELLKDEKKVKSISDLDVISWNNCMIFPGTRYYAQGLSEGWFNENKYREVLAKKGLFCTKVPEELNFSKIPETELDAFRYRNAYPI